MTEENLLSHSQANVSSHGGAPAPHYDQSFFGHGKLLLTGEYFILDGAEGLALPTKAGQSLGVRYSKSFDPKLIWRSYDMDGNLWFESSFEFWHFDCLDENPSADVLTLQKILRSVRQQNKHFLREECEVLVETFLDFPISWGLGSSSTLIYKIAQWAYISPFELAFKALQESSGYDIACAQCTEPILYQKKSLMPKWGTVHFDPPFKENIYFIHQGVKKNTQDAIKDYRKLQPAPISLVERISELTRSCIKTQSLDEFNQILCEHESLVAEHLQLVPLKEQRFSNYWGEIKSLGAWGGDFALVTSDRSPKEIFRYFQSLGLDTILSFDDLILKKPRTDLGQGNGDFVH